MMGLGFTLAMLLLGAAREIIGSGTLFADASLLLGPAFAFLELELIPDYQGFLLVVLPPGGFLALGFWTVGKWLSARRRRLACSSLRMSCDAPCVLGDPLASLCWLANDLARRGESLRAGDLVTTGCCTAVIEARPGDRVEADFGSFGRVAVTFVS